MILGRVLIPSIGTKDVSRHTVKGVQSSKLLLVGLLGIIPTALLLSEIIPDTS